MVDKFWARLARFIGNRPALVELIIRMAQRTPYSQIYNRDGTDYMGRWWFMPRWLLGRDETEHYFPFAWLPIVARVHHIQSPDGRDLHDHPATYRSIIMRGWYVEEDIDCNLHLRQQGDTVTAPAHHFHTITEISPGGVWTLFIMRKKSNEWGFLVDGDKVPWREYYKKAAIPK